MRRWHTPWRRSYPHVLSTETAYGGRGRETVLEQDDRSLVECVRRELTSMVGITTAPTYTEVHRWRKGMPQYVLGHRDRLAKVHQELAKWPGLYITGAGLSGIGIPDCIREGTKVGHQLLQDRAHIR